MATVPVLCVGDLMTDVLARAGAPTAVASDTSAEVRVSGGGAAANTAAWLGALGHPVSFWGRAGDDLFGHAGVEQLRRGRVHTRVVLDRDRPTGTVVVVVGPDGERSMYPDAGANAALDAGDLPVDLLKAGNHLHLSGYTLLRDGSRAAGLAALAAARASGARISVDPASAAPLAAAGPATVLGWLAGADLLLANDEEACLLAGLPGDPWSAGAALTASFGEVVVKLGADGAVRFRGDEEPVHVPAVDVPVVDTTGAGDCFAAAFLPPWLAGAPPLTALSAGCALAARVVVRPGARPDR